MAVNVSSYTLPEKTKNRLKSLLASVQVANEVIEGAKLAAQKYADKFNAATEAALEQFDLTPQTEGISVDWETGVITVKTEVPDLPPVVEPKSVEPEPVVPVEPITESAPESV